MYLVDKFSVLNAFDILDTVFLLSTFCILDAFCLLCFSAGTFCRFGITLSTDL